MAGSMSRFAAGCWEEVLSQSAVVPCRDGRAKISRTVR
jgi:hypothetical protein